MFAAGLSHLTLGYIHSIYKHLFYMQLREPCIYVNVRTLLYCNRYTQETERRRQRHREKEIVIDRERKRDGDTLCTYTAHPKQLFIKVSF